MNLNVLPPRNTYLLGAAFSAGVWNGNEGQTRFGDAPRENLSVIEKIEVMAETLIPVGLTHLEFHGFELPPTPDEAGPILEKVKSVGLKVGMLSGDIFKSPTFAGGALDHPNEKVRQKAVESITSMFALASEVAEISVIWNGRMGVCLPGQKDPVMSTRYIIEGLTEIGNQMLALPNPLRIGLEPKPNEPQGSSYMATVGEALFLIAMLPENLQPLFGLNPETAHSLMAGLDYNIDLGLALSAKRLFWTHLNDQMGPKFDQDYPFGSLHPVHALETMIILQDNKYDQPLGVDVQPLPTDTDKQYFDSVKTSICNAKWLLEVAENLLRKRGEALQEMRSENNAQEISRLFTQYLGDRFYLYD